jgi:hypothetical protein
LIWMYFTCLRFALRVICSFIMPGWLENFSFQYSFPISSFLWFHHYPVL